MSTRESTSLKSQTSTLRSTMADLKKQLNGELLTGRRLKINLAPIKWREIKQGVLGNKIDSITAYQMQTEPNEVSSVYKRDFSLSNSNTPRSTRNSLISTP